MLSAICDVLQISLSIKILHSVQEINYVIPLYLIHRAHSKLRVFQVVSFHNVNNIRDNNNHINKNDIRFLKMINLLMPKEWTSI